MNDADVDFDFYFGAMSPYSWFAAERLSAVATPIRWRPIFVGGLFKARGRTAWGLTPGRAGKVADCERRARELGLGTVSWPEPWPTSDLLVARAMVVADRLGALERFALAAMRACFREGRDLATVDAVAHVARSAGLYDSAVLRAAHSEEVKEELRQANAEAMVAGVFGVPTFVLAGKSAWGEDQLDSILNRTEGG